MRYRVTLIYREVPLRFAIHEVEADNGMQAREKAEIIAQEKSPELKAMPVIRCLTDEIP